MPTQYYEMVLDYTRFVLKHSSDDLQELVVALWVLFSLVGSLVVCLFPCCTCKCARCHAEPIRHRQTWTDWSVNSREEQDQVLTALAASQAAYKQAFNSRQEICTHLPGVRLKASSVYEKWGLAESEEWKLYDKVAEGSDDSMQVLVIAFRGASFDGMNTEGIQQAYQRMGASSAAHQAGAATLLSRLAMAGQLINLAGAVRQAIPRDIRVDLQATPENNFHGGFERRARQFLQWLGGNDYREGVRRLKDHALEDGGHPVWLVGHSIGGAVATVVTLHVMEHSEAAHIEQLQRTLRCATFGAPMVHSGEAAPTLPIRETNASAMVSNFVHVDDPVPRILVAPILGWFDPRRLRGIQNDYLQYRPLGTYYLLDDHLPDAQLPEGVITARGDTFETIRSRLDRSQRCSMVVQATERHSLHFTYSKYIELLNTNRTWNDPADTTTPRTGNTGTRLLRPAEIEGTVLVPV